MHRRWNLPTMTVERYVVASVRVRTRVDTWHPIDTEFNTDAALTGVIGPGYCGAMEQLDAT